MHKRLAEFFIIDVFVCIDTIYRYLKNIHNPIEFVSNEVVFKIVTHELEIVGEATNNLLKDTSIQHLVKPAWRDVVNFRNVISHEYFGLNFEEIFDIVTTEVPLFEQELLVLAQQIKHTENFVLALVETKKDLSRINRFEAIKCLQRLEQTLGSVDFYNYICNNSVQDVIPAQAGIQAQIESFC